MKVKFKFYYRLSHEGRDRYGHYPDLVMARDINDLPIGEPHPFYILSGALSDFPDYTPSLVDDVLKQIERIEHGEIPSYEYEGQGFVQHMSRDRVRFEHTVFGECPEWPIWYCTLAQYKTALQGYRRFLDMPKNIDSELYVELPDGEPNLASGE